MIAWLGVSLIIPQPDSLHESLSHPRISLTHESLSLSLGSRYSSITRQRKASFTPHTPRQNDSVRIGKCRCFERCQIWELVIDRPRPCSQLNIRSQWSHEYMKHRRRGRHEGREHPILRFIIEPRTYSASCEQWVLVIESMFK